MELRQNEKHLSNIIAQAKFKTHMLEQSKKQIYTYNKTYISKKININTIYLDNLKKYDIWPVHGKILHYFGEIEQGNLRNKGLIIKASEGSKVVAIADGRVLIADWLQGYGFMVVIDHGKGDMSLYGYNQTTLVKVGDKVKANQPVALVGASGGHGIPSLYFEIRHQGKAIDPVIWLNKSHLLKK